MAQTPEPDAPKRANVGPRQSADSLQPPPPGYPAPAHASSIDRPSPTDAEARTEILSFLYVNVGAWADLRRLAGESYDRVLADLRLLVQHEVIDQGGSELGTDRDGFLAVFSSPRSSIAAAVGVRRSISSHTWPHDGIVQPRIGLHTGESKKTIGGLLSLDASRAEEIAAVSNAGQIVLSQATASLAANPMPEGLRLSDLGLHRLRDLGRPERLFQVEEEGVRSEFPALRSLDNPVMLHNLPERLSSFVGREREQTEIRQLLLSDRLVTLIGPGGAGKTRLALQVAAQLLDGEGDGVWLVELAGVSDPDYVTTVVASALTIQPDAGRPLEDSLVDCLRHQRILLILDNCEHVVSAAATLCDSFLKSCPGVHVLATSREPLAIDGEAVFRVPPLSLPPVGAADPHAFDAIRLFEERAHSNQPSFVLNDTNRELVVSLCRQLDGIPLALELAAARLRSTSLAQVYGHLDDRFSLLTGGSRSALPRQQTLLATVDWSYDLLDRDEQHLLKRLSVFAGDFLLEEVEDLSARVGDDRLRVIDQLGSLVDKSLVVFDSAPSWPRYRLLETIRKFSWDKVRIEDGEDGQKVLSDAHAAVYLELVESAEPHLRAPEQLEWFDRLDIEHDNIRAAEGHLLADPMSTVKAMRMAVSMKWFWQIRSHRVEALDVFTQLSQRAELEQTPVLAARILNAGGEFLFGVNADEAADRFERAVAIARRTGEGDICALALSFLASIANQRGDPHKESELRGQAIDLARAGGDPLILGDVLSGPSDDPDYARRLEEAISCYDTVGDRTGRYIALLDLGAVSLTQGERGVARGHLEAAVELGRVLGIGKDQTLMVNVAEACLLDGDFARAKDLYKDAVRVARRHADARAAQYAVLGLALCSSADGDNRLAARLHGLADAQLRALGYVWAPDNLALAEADRSHLRSAMGSERFVAEFESGELWDFDEAISSVT